MAANDFGHTRLSRLRPDAVYARIKGFGPSVKHIQRERANSVCEGKQSMGMMNTPHSESRHELCPVQQSQSFLGFKMNGLPPELLQDVLRLVLLPFVANVAKADERQRQVRQRCKIAGGPERSHL